MRNAMRKVSLLLVVLLLVAILPTATHASPPVGETHRHNWVLVSNVGATCTSPGSMTWRCTLCGQTYTESTPALGHLGQWVTTEATCTEEGLKSFTCIRCGMKMEYTTPKKGHTPVALAGKAATCTEAGLTEGQKCSTCGTVLKAQETIAALGHDWDEGKVTVQPWLLSPGERTFTCKRDPSHTRTEEIEPSADAVFASLSTGSWSMTTFDLANITPLIITEQPVGGAVTRYGDETHLLHVAASGGEGAYTYGWFSSPVNETDWLPGLWILASIHYSGRLTEPDYEASEGGRRYWCVVTDEAGNSAVSDTVVVEYKLSIGKQPEDVNLQLDDPHFYCEAIDGSGNYTYTWFDSEMGILGEGQSYPATEPGICYCYCVVKDNVTGETVESEYCEVYDEEPFRLVRITKDCELWPEETGMVVAAFSGGTPDYEIWWDKDGTAINSVEGLVDDHPGSHVDDVGPGKYTVHAVDAHGEVVKATCTISEKHLTISKQPEGGNLPKKGGWLQLTTEIEDGVAPYRFELYRNGTSYVGGDSDTNVCTLTAWHSGSYYFYVEDSQGHTATSDYAYVGEPDFHIKDQTESATLAKPGDTASLFVEAEGGLEPYTYLWSIKRYTTRYKVGDARTFSADSPGEYLCRVVDAEGTMIHSKAIQVTYTGDAPWITVQPQGGVLESGGSVYIYCDAVSGSGGELRFDWERTATGVRPSWSNVSRRGGSYRSIDVTQTGAYRCKVTDTKTGKYTYTQSAIVNEELACSIDMEQMVGHETMMVNIHVKGGIGPYTYTVYMDYPIQNGKDFDHPFMKEHSAKYDTIDEIDGTRDWIGMVKNYVYKTSAGEWDLSIYWPTYYFVITDGTGNKWTSVEYNFMPGFVKGE